MTRFQTILIASLCAASSYPAMIVQGRLLPDTSCFAVQDAWQRIDTAVDRFYHHLKNLISEMVRCDAQWFGKFLLFVILCLIITLIVILVFWIVSLIKKKMKEL